MNERRRDLVVGAGGAALLIAADLFTPYACAERDARHEAPFEARSIADGAAAEGKDITTVAPIRE